jgi:ribonuclease HI
MKDQIVADFIVGHNIDQNSDESCNLVSIHQWKLFFDGSASREGQGVGVVLVSPRGAMFEQSVHLEYFYTNNQAEYGVEYEVILSGLQILSSMGIKHVEAFGDSLLVVQQVAGVFQCFNRSLNVYLDKCLEIISLFIDFTMHHISRNKNTVVNDSAQQEKNWMFWFAKLDNPVFGRCTVRQSILLNQIQQN